MRNNNIKGFTRSKPMVVYFHRYPIEFERMQFQGLEELIKEIKKKYNLTYFSMKGKKIEIDLNLRKDLNIQEIPIKINNKDLFEKYFKTFLYYIYLPFTLYRLKRLKPDFIICKETLPFVPYLIGKMRIPYLIDISDWWWSIIFGKSRIGRRFANFMERIEVNKWAKQNCLLVVHTDAEGRLVSNLGITNPHKIVKINAPIMEELYFPIGKNKAKTIREKLNFKKNDFVVAVHGIIHPSKGYDQILKWWSTIIKECPHFKLMIIGGAGQENLCKKLISDLKLENNVLMTGWLPTQDEVNLYLNSADCLLVTRRNTPENQGVMPSALFHSMSTGKPTIITNLPGMSEIVSDKKNGFTFEPDNYESFKKTLEQVNKNKSFAEKVGKKGMKDAKELFDPKKAAKGYLRIIDNKIKDK